MKFQKIIFLISLLSTLLLIFLAQTIEQTQIGTVKSIQFSDDKITIKIENNSAELIIFNAKQINLSKGDQIKFQGKHDIYKNKSQIIVDKLLCLT